MKSKNTLWNQYKCAGCGHYTIVKQEGPGVAPAMLICRATVGCTSVAFSSFYNVPQNDDQIPHVIFFRTNTPEELEEYLRKEQSEELWEQWREHFNKGGVLIRKGPREPEVVSEPEPESVEES